VVFKKGREKQKKIEEKREFLYKIGFWQNGVKTNIIVDT